jgi:Tat protein secretion system quality control protein TatD with DNase activity
MIDTHAHLDSTFCDISRVVGLKAVILAGSNIENSKNNLLLAKKYSQILPVVGIHPQEINDDINLLEELVKNPD